MNSSFNVKLNKPYVRTEVPGPRASKHWEQEKTMIGPGLSSVVQWAELCFSEAEGPYLIDIDGNTYIDLMGASGVNSIGHSHPKFVEALSKQLSSWTIGGFASPARLDMLRTLRRILPNGLERIQLYTGGTEAVEAALRLAKAFTGKFEFLGFWNGYHGKTMGSMALTDGAKWERGPLPTGFYSTPYAYCYRCPFQLEFPSCDFVCVDHVREVIQHQTTGALAGVVVEPIQGRAGNLVPPPGYLEALLSIAHEFDALLIADEMITGFGRTGKMFACEHDDVVPDIVVVGKGMGGGFPVTGVISSSAIMSAPPYSNPSASSSSFGGFPTACRAVDAVVQIIIEEGLVQHSAQFGVDLLNMLKPLEQQIPIVGRVRGKGLMIGIELVYGEKGKQPVSKDAMHQVYSALLQRGVLVMLGGNSIRLYPPLSIAPDIGRKAVMIIAEVLREQSAAITGATI
jgi:4-aminobutyrate aminotransferase/4-aminobutyrate aminotransferase/(S)-3-amino-2-methylpropionate transaminase